MGRVMRSLLWLGSIPYGIAVAARNRRYDRGKAEIHRCDVPVVSVGNLTTGGTGKTPVVCLLAMWFRQHAIRVAIVSRGYGRDDKDFNDEALELQQRLPDVPHVQDPDRVAAATVAVEELESQLILMDDGFQHRRLHRDLDIVIVDASCPFGYGYQLPRGLLREAVRGIRRADLVILTRCHHASPEVIDNIVATIKTHHAKIEVLKSNHQPTELLVHPQRRIPLESIRDSNVAVLSAIGNPDAFQQTVEGCGANMIGTLQLPDHDAFDPETMRQVRAWIESLSCRPDYVVCTHKDLVKIQADRIAGIDLVAMMIELQIIGDSSALYDRLETLIADHD